MTTTDLENATQTQLEEPKMFAVLLHNDDFTPMDFVIHVLTEIFSHSEHEATQLMLQVHEKGEAVCGIYLFEIAETKALAVKESAEQEEYPLRCSLREQ